MISINFKVFLITTFIIIIATTGVGAVNYTIQTGYFSQPSNAQNLSQKLAEVGLEVFNYQEGNRHYVVVGNYDNYNSARNTLTKVKTIVEGAYIRKISFELNNKTSEKSQEEVNAEIVPKNDKQKIKNEQKELNINKCELDKLVEKMEYLKYIKLVLKDDNVKKYAISNIIPYINKFTNEYLSEVGFNFYVTIDN